LNISNKEIKCKLKKGKIIGRDAFIGGNVKITQNQSKHKALRLMTGDYSEVDI